MLWLKYKGIQRNINSLVHYNCHIQRHGLLWDVNESKAEGMRPNGSALEKRAEESISNLNNLSTEKKKRKTYIQWELKVSCLDDNDYQQIITKIIAYLPPPVGGWRKESRERKRTGYLGNSQVHHLVIV